MGERIGMNNNKQIPTWMLIAVVIGLGQLTWFLHTRFGFGLLTKSSLALAVLAAGAVAVLYGLRVMKGKKRANNANRTKKA